MYCNFGTLKDKLIRDRIVVGPRNHDLSEKLQLDPKLTLEKAMNLARQRETVKQQQSILVGGFQSKSADVNSIVKGKPHRKKHKKPKEKIPPSTTPQSKHQENIKKKPHRKKHEKPKEKIPPSTTPQSKHKSSVPGALEVFTRRRHAQHVASSITNAQKYM